MDAYKICNYCKHNLIITKFSINHKTSVYYKLCDLCRIKNNIRSKLSHSLKCPHNKRKERCIECHGSEICHHSKRKHRCKDCVGISICIHKKDKYTCKECSGIGICIHGIVKSGCKKCNCPINITIRRWLGSSRYEDKLKNRFDIYNFIDINFCKSLIEEYPVCYYADCNMEIQYIDYNDTLATIERKDNSIGHIKSNCVIACKKCNCSIFANLLL